MDDVQKYIDNGSFAPCVGCGIMHETVFGPCCGKCANEKYVYARLTGTGQFVIATCEEYWLVGDSILGLMKENEQFKNALIELGGGELDVYWSDFCMANNP